MIFEIQWSPAPAPAPALFFFFFFKVKCRNQHARKFQHYSTMSFADWKKSGSKEKFEVWKAQQPVSNDAKKVGMYMFCKKNHKKKSITGQTNIYTWRIDDSVQSTSCTVAEETIG